MMNPRFFCPDGLLPDSDMPLPTAVAHHAERVLRLAVGDAVTLFDGRGGECAATLLALGKQPLARLGPRQEADRESPLAITLVQALASGDKMDWVVQKAVEPGVRSVQPVAAERSVLRLDGERAERHDVAEPDAHQHEKRQHTVFFGRGATVLGVHGEEADDESR